MLSSALLPILALGLLPAFGAALGAALAERMDTPGWLTGAALHAAAGIAIAVVSIELMPRIIQNTPAVAFVAAFLLGAAISVAIARGVRYLRKHTQAQGGGRMVYVATAVDLASDGLMTGAGSAIASGLGVILGTSQVIANMPGGFATTANFKSQDVPKGRRRWFAISYPLVAIASVSAGFLLLQRASSATQHLVLAVMVGVLLLATVEDTLPEADRPQPPRWVSTLAFAIGFGAFALFSSLVG